MSESNGVVRHFNPAWFASVMGTGGLASALHAALGSIPLFEGIADILVGLNIALFILFLIPWTARWVLHFDRLSEDLKHPMLGNFFVTMPVGAIILGANLLLVGPDFLDRSFVGATAVVLFAVAAVLILFFTVLVMHIAYVRENLQPEQINFAWFITPVADIVVPVLGVPLVALLKDSNPGAAQFINLLNLAFFGIGFLLFIFIGAIVFNRLISHKLPHAQVSPTFWILLGPIGIGTVALFGIAGSAQSLGLLPDPSGMKLAGVLLWGFGLWAFIQTLVVTIKYWREGIPFSMTWWAFIFPFAAYVLATFQVGGFLHSPVVHVYGLALLALLALMWLIVFVRSLVSLPALLAPPAQQKKA
ncbi:MAG TPA: hypothetical protein VMV83_15370 [Rectinemataceae bacterium]|nr:hypothetical protein [Rectinemataceae bacterium]